MQSNCFRSLPLLVRRPQRCQSLVLLLLLLSLSSAVIHGAEYRVGIGKSDITGPAAEIGMMGYGDAQQKAGGILNRLYARAFVIEEADKHSTAVRVLIVHCDLHAVYQLVHQEVLRRLKLEYNGVYTEQNVVLHATHTHGGPGGMSAYFLYDVSIFGYLEENFAVIVDGIMRAVEIAHRCIVAGTIHFSRGEVIDGGVNRSPEAYGANPEQELRKYKSNHDDELRLLQFRDAKEDTLLGVLAFYPVHPTSLTRFNSLITGDNKGYAEFLLEQRFPGLVAAVGISNAGDVSPNLVDNGDGTFSGEGATDLESAEIIGKRQADTILDLLQQKDVTSMLVSGSLRSHLSYVDFANVTIKNRTPTESEPYADRTCPGVLGQNFGAGTEDGRGFAVLKEGSLDANRLFKVLSQLVKVTPEWIQQCHTNNKVPLLATGLMLPVKWVPEILPVQVVKLGQIGLAVTNFEVSTMAGRRIRATVQDVLAKVGVQDVEVVAMSNAYAQYVTTKEEYMTQHYEGASTLFGPNQLEALQQELARVAASVVDPSIPIDVGPMPPQFNRSSLYSFQTPVVVDTPGWGKQFGDLRVDAREAYVIGSNVTVAFYGGHPRNQFAKIHSFCDVEMETASGKFETLFTDSHWDVRYLWQRTWLTESTSTCQWLLRRATPDNSVAIASGRYRVRHRGYSKSITGEMAYYEGASSAFHVMSTGADDLTSMATAQVCVAEVC
uniref:Neutral ceramidase n=1 Tax=Globisporangium ultimum (strain ATCC 200006 / CBS 805.95 / DAOM BR144) TaxID=431595 RepID=K3WW21_GLOUD